MYFQIPPQPSYPPPGNVVWIVTHLLWRHKGIVSDRWHNGKPMVISASARAGAVCEESWDVFSDGKQVFDGGYPSQLPQWDVLHRARMLIGRRYQLIEFNCDHFVALAHGDEEPRSPQLAGTMTIALLAVLVRVATAR
jgi:hypothetical protein